VSPTDSSTCKIINFTVIKARDSGVPKPLGFLPLEFEVDLAVENPDKAWKKGLIRFGLY
jgi:hypothetical protein